ncbi:DUF4270 domain-containing protein [Winogradskyella sp. R77965]|uniref:DUF4270 domain-containing protein n=1 Tax=Winogradskyella sp. R77965 TaxID=3093872 RepID=UPI0037DD4829
MSLILLSFIACDEDFATLKSDIINEENATNFDILAEQYDIITYTEALGPVQTNNLGLSTLGTYDDAYGRTTSSFLTQVNASPYEPSFGEGVSIDSVVLRIPYFSRATDIDEDGNITYEIDSIIGTNKIKLRLFESSYFIRDFDPTGDFNDSQDYYSNKSASNSESISIAALESKELNFIPNLNPEQNKHISLDADGNTEISEDGFTLTKIEGVGEEATTVVTRESPGLRIKLDTTFWRDKIIEKEGDAVLSSQNNFTEYFRGLYFKAETVNDKGSLMLLNTASASSSIIIYYTSLTASTTDDASATEQNTFTLTFTPNRINFMDNDFTTTIEDGNSETGDSRLYLKGGEGALARIKLFNGDDIDEDDNTFNSFETFKNEFVETDEDGNFVKSKRLVNEANLVFYVDQDAIHTPSNMQDDEPNRIYLYEIENKAPLVDFDLDITNSSLPSFSKFNHLGPLQRVDDEPDGNGIKYKINITEHINDLIVRDSTNVELGLVVSLNVNLEETLLQRKVLSIEDTDLTAPTSSILSPRGTILHGNNTEDENKKVYLEIYYTEPNN